MTITVGVTDDRWVEFLRADDRLLEANFWLPSGGAFRSLAEGETFLFKTKAPRPALVGGGTFSGFLELRVSEAWAFFGPGNGCSTEQELHDAIQIYRHRTGKPFEADPNIGCIMLGGLFFADPGHELPEPPSWARNIVTWKNFRPADADWDYVNTAAQVLRTNTRLDTAWGVAQETTIDDLHVPRYGTPRLVAPRMGQGAFRAKVTTAYDWTCAITGSQNAAVLEAAHIYAYGDGGVHRISNGLLLRRDVHKLFDDGYLSVSDDYRLMVSPQLKIDTGNGVEFYERAGQGEVIRLPERPEARPNPEHLAWHRENRFRSA